MKEAQPLLGLLWAAWPCGTAEEEEEEEIAPAQAFPSTSNVFSSDDLISKD